MQRPRFIRQLDKNRVLFLPIDLRPEDKATVIDELGVLVDDLHARARNLRRWNHRPNESARLSKAADAISEVRKVFQRTS